MTRITRYNPTRLMPPGARYDDDFGFWPMTRLHQQMNRLFSDAFRGFEEGGEESREGWTFNPVVDVEQQDKQYEVSVELPGVISDDVNVECTDDMLVISGSKERKQTRGEGENRQSERVYGSFQRAFRLPDDALRDKIEARFSDGVLTVSIPRDENRKQESTRRIEVQRDAPQGREQEGRQQAQKSGEEEPRPSARH
jgi:HSP20 family protein